MCVYVHTCLCVCVCVCVCLECSSRSRGVCVLCVVGEREREREREREERGAGKRYFFGGVVCAMVGLSSRVGAELRRGGGGAWSALMLRASSYGDALVDLGQGKPDFQGSLVARSCAAKFVMGDVDGGKANQYCQIQGGAELLDSLVHFYTRHFGMSIDKSNVIITAGGTQVRIPSLCIYTQTYPPVRIIILGSVDDNE